MCTWDYLDKLLYAIVLDAKNFIRIIRLGKINKREFYFTTYQATQQIMIRPLSQSYIPHMTHNNILRHIRWTVEHDVFIAPSKKF